MSSPKTWKLTRPVRRNKRGAVSYVNIVFAPNDCRSSALGMHTSLFGSTFFKWQTNEMERRRRRKKRKEDDERRKKKKEKKRRKKDEEKRSKKKFKTKMK